MRYASVFGYDGPMPRARFLVLAAAFLAALTACGNPEIDKRLLELSQAQTKLERQVLELTSTHAELTRQLGEVNKEIAAIKADDDEDDEDDEDDDKADSPKGKSPPKTR